MLSPHRRILSKPKSSSKKINKTMYTNVDSWSLPNDSTIHAVRFQNNQTLCCIIFSFWREALWQVVQTIMKLRGPLFSWIEEADQNPQIVCRDDPQEAQMAYIWSYTIGKGPYKGIIENQEIRRVGLSETHASGNREACTHNDWWKANWWNKFQQEGSRRTRNDIVWEFLKGLRTQTTNWRISLSRWSWSDEC